MTFRKAADARNATVDGVIPDAAAAPTGEDQLITRNDLATAAGQHHQHLHDPRFQGLGRPVHNDFARRRADLDSAQGKRGFARKVDRLILRLNIHG